MEETLHGSVKYTINRIITIIIIVIVIIIITDIPLDD